MATISFFGGGGPYAINNLGGSGLGFYGSSFGSSVAVGERNSTTFCTSSNGLTEGAQVNNIKWVNTSSGEINGASAVHLRQIPNYLATLNIRFEHGTAVKTQNAKVRIYDRSNINNDPSGVTCSVYETRKVNVPQTLDGSGSNTWTNVHGSAVILDLLASPSISGTSPNGANSTGVRHDWYLAISPSPDSIGSKTQFGLFASVEYL